MKAVILVVFVLTVAAVLCLLEAYREQQYFKVTEDGVVSRLSLIHISEPTRRS